MAYDPINTTVVQRSAVFGEGHLSRCGREVKCGRGVLGVNGREDVKPGERSLLCMRESDKDGTATHIKCAIATTYKALNWRAACTSGTFSGDPIILMPENLKLPFYPPTDGIVRHDSHLRKAGVIRPGIEPGSPWWGASRQAAQPPRANFTVNNLYSHEWLAVNRGRTRRRAGNTRPRFVTRAGTGHAPRTTHNRARPTKALSFGSLSYLLCAGSLSRDCLHLALHLREVLGRGYTGCRTTSLKQVQLLKKLHYLRTSSDRSCFSFKENSFHKKFRTTSLLCCAPIDCFERQRVYNFVLSLCTRSFALSRALSDELRRPESVLSDIIMTSSREQDYDRALFGPIETRSQSALSCSHCREYVIMTSERTLSGRLNMSERVPLNMISRLSASAVCMTSQRNERVVVVIPQSESLREPEAVLSPGCPKECSLERSPPSALMHSRFHSSVSHPLDQSSHEHLTRRRPAISSRRPQLTSLAHTRQAASIKDCRPLGCGSGRRSVTPTSLAVVGIHGIPRRGDQEAASASFLEEGRARWVSDYGAGSALTRFVAIIGPFIPDTVDGSPIPPHDNYFVIKHKTPACLFMPQRIPDSHSQIGCARLWVQALCFIGYCMLRVSLLQSYREYYQALIGERRSNMCPASNATLLAGICGCWNVRLGKLEIPEKTRRPAASCGTIPTCGKSGSDPAGNRTRFALVRVQSRHFCSLERLKLYCCISTRILTIGCSRGSMETFQRTCLLGAAVVERFDHSPSTKANRVQSPAGILPNFLK
ncbi:hypothetical protein PR048_009277 [Dryococelus australis]|uniref:Uncharacterized protein n=1 Tax=Dryococelus australis TaxID=614101 RepID=A0ABQ9HZJ5_9NEOP|nr:hypothetical protein PR048_009277 [Dryococelus australis]